MRSKLMVSGLAWVMAWGGVMVAEAWGDDARTVNWPSFRGERASGVAEGVQLVRSFDVASGEGVRWETEIPGLGHSSPVVWEDRIFVTTAISLDAEEQLRTGLFGDIEPAEEDGEFIWRVYCLDKQTGEVLWYDDAHQGSPGAARHPKATHANPTAATDGERVVVFFGSEGLYAYDMDGQLEWEVDFGVLDVGFFQVPEAQWGFASSPVLHDGLVIVQVDTQDEQFVAALDASDGSTVWRTERDDVPTWSTPTVAEHDGQWQVVVNGWRHIGGYDLSDGQPLWWLEGGGDLPVPTPVVAEGKVFITNSHGGQSPLYAVELDARGDVTPQRGGALPEGLAWWEPNNGAYMQTPLVLDGYVYSARDNGVLSVYDARSGERVMRERIGGGGMGFTASPVAADGHIYFAAEDGQVFVFRAVGDGTVELVAESEAGAGVLATPAISEDVLLIRTTEGVVAIGG